MARKPQPGGDRNAWGGVLNEFLTVAHEADGSIKSATVEALVADAIADDTTVEAAVVAAVADDPTITGLATRLDPGAAGTVGASLSQGPAGPAWRKDAVSADWFSDLNDAITAAGVGGRVVLSPGVEYVQASPLIAVNNLTIEGDSRHGSVIKYSGAAAIQSAGYTTASVTGFRVFNVTLDGNNVGGMGIDARGFIECHFDMVKIWNPTSHGIWFGGDTDMGGWTNTVRRSEIRAPLVGAAVYVSGRTSGGTGAATGNQIVVESSTLFNREAATSYAVNVEEGEGNTFLANDMGYGVASGAAIRLGGAMAARNRFIANRTESVKRAVLIASGENNVFLANSFGLSPNSEFHGAEVYGGTRNVFRDNWWDAQGLGPRVWENGGSGTFRTVVDDLTPTYTRGSAEYANTGTENKGTIVVPNAGGDVAAGSHVSGEAYPRYLQTGLGAMLWGSGSAAQDTILERKAANILGTGDGDRFVAAGGFGVGVHSEGIVATPGASVGTITHKLKIFDAAGNHIGWIPISNG